MRRLSKFQGGTIGLSAALMLVGYAVLASAEETPRPVEATSWDQTVSVAATQAQQLASQASAWYRQTPPMDRVTWGGLIACAVLGMLVLLERLWKLRRARVLPGKFVDRFLDRVRDGHLDQGKGVDLCELNPSPASRIALSALRRWGRPTADLERAVQLARQVEADRLRRNVGTLRRIAALSPLLGLLGGLLSAGRSLSALGQAAPPESWGPAVAHALGPLTAGVALAILALVAYDGLVGKVEALNGDLDRLGTETIDAIAMATAPPVSMPSNPAPIEPRHLGGGPHFGAVTPIRSPRPIRVEIPDRMRE